MRQPEAWLGLESRELRTGSWMGVTKYRMLGAQVSAAEAEGVVALRVAPASRSKVESRRLAIECTVYCVCRRPLGYLGGVLGMSGWRQGNAAEDPLPPQRPTRCLSDFACVYCSVCVSCLVSLTN